MRNLSIRWCAGQPVFYRPETTDEKVIKEVIDNRAYRRASAGFDVERGEHWLDLGANIGAFAIYCKLKGATADCYEPEPGCFSILKKNVPELLLINAAVTHVIQDTVSLWTSSIHGNHYRGTVVGCAKGKLNKQPIEVANVFAGDIVKSYDGVKMDIEGEELELIDRGLIPSCKKLCLEYHTSRDQSMERMVARVARLRDMFRVVSYCPELDRLMEAGGNQKSFHDRVIYCMGRK